MIVSFDLYVDFDVVEPVDEEVHSSHTHTSIDSMTKEEAAANRRIGTTSSTFAEFFVYFDMSEYPEVYPTDAEFTVTYDITTAETSDVIVSFDVFTPRQIFNKTRSLNVKTSSILGSHSAGLYRFIILPKIGGVWDFRYKHELSVDLFDNNGVVIWWEPIGVDEYSVYVKAPGDSDFALLSIVAAAPWRYTYA